MTAVRVSRDGMPSLWSGSRPRSDGRSRSSRPPCRRAREGTGLVATARRRPSAPDAGVGTWQGRADKPIPLRVAFERAGQCDGRDRPPPLPSVMTTCDGTRLDLSVSAITSGQRTRKSRQHMPGLTRRPPCRPKRVRPGFRLAGDSARSRSASYRGQPARTARSTSRSPTPGSTLWTPARYRSASGRLSSTSRGGSPIGSNVHSDGNSRAAAPAPDSGRGLRGCRGEDVPPRPR